MEAFQVTEAGNRVRWHVAGAEAGHGEAYTQDGGRLGVLVARFPYVIADRVFQVAGIVDQSDEFSG